MNESKEPKNIRVYKTLDCCCFYRARDKWGAFSNMNTNFMFSLSDIRIPSSEALYQSLKFQCYPEIQNEILAAPDPVTAKRIAYKHVGLMDSNAINALLYMRFSIYMKYQSYQEYFDEIFSLTLGRPIVEISSRDDYWGAKVVNANLVGKNALGRLWMELRQNGGRCNIDPTRGFMIQESKYTISNTPMKIPLNVTTMNLA